MKTKEEFVDILVRHQRGDSIRKIARDLRMSRNTVRKYINEKRAAPEYTLRKRRVSYLDPYREYITARVNAAKPEWIPATVVFKEICKQGYKGKISILRAYLRTLKPKIKEEPLVRFETPKGKQLQIDFITVSIAKHRYKAFVATLGHSRYCYVEFFENEKSNSWITGIKHTFEYIGGVTEEILCDNAKALIVARDAYGEGKHKFNDCLLDLSKEYGFSIKACKPYRAKTKGKVERFNGYLKHSFIIPLLTIFKQNDLELDISTLNFKVKTWLLNEANCRIHGTTGVRPCDVFKEEAKFLKALPQTAINPTIVVKENELTSTNVNSLNQRQMPVLDIQPSPIIFDFLLNKKYRRK